MSIFLQIHGNAAVIDPVPAVMVYNPGPNYSLVNSVHFHPWQNLCCVTYTHNNKVVLYAINSAGQPEEIQSLRNPLAQLNEPQHAAFSPDGEKIVVANWGNQALTVYQRDKREFYGAKPAAVIPPHSSLQQHKPHGIAFSPRGGYLAIAYGAANYHGKGVALFRAVDGGMDFELIDLLQESELPGIPKGITFSPDGTALLVTFSDANCLAIYNLSGEAIETIPRQVVQGEESQISRPEDVKISPDGSYCAVTNSACDTVTFYPFDKTSNQITQSTPCDILKNPEAHFHFPHGIAFSPDGVYLLVTEFGEVETAEDGNILWTSETKPEQSKFNLYRLTPRK